MANSCDTTYTIRCVDIQQATELEEKLNSWLVDQHGHKNGWLGNILINSGLAEYDEEDSSWSNHIFDGQTRGHLVGPVERYGEELSIMTDTAWNPMHKVWEYVVGKFAPGAEIVYNSEEVHTTNDQDLVNKYIIDFYGYDMLADGDDVPEECKDELDKNGFVYVDSMGTMFAESDTLAKLDKFFMEHKDDYCQFAIDGDECLELIKILFPRESNITYEDLCTKVGLSDWSSVLTVDRWTEYPLEVPALDVFS